MWYRKLGCEAALNRFGVIQGVGKWAEFITNGSGRQHWFVGVRYVFWENGEIVSQKNDGMRGGEMVCDKFEWFGGFCITCGMNLVGLDGDL